MLFLWKASVLSLGEAEGLLSGVNTSTMGLRIRADLIFVLLVGILVSMHGLRLGKRRAEDESPMQILVSLAAGLCACGGLLLIPAIDRRGHLPHLGIAASNPSLALLFYALYCLVLGSLFAASRLVGRWQRREPR